MDDEPNVRLVFRTALESSDHALTMAEDGESALRALEEAPCDLVLLDLLMPVMGGMEVLRRLRETGNDVPVVAVTAHGDVPNAVEAMKLGAIDFLPKPIAPDDLRGAVGVVLLRHASARQGPDRLARAPETVMATSEFARNLSRAKRALNCRWFDEAEVCVRQAIALEPDSAEAHNLMGVLNELRGEHDASYREYRAALKADRHYVPSRYNMAQYYERFHFGRSDVPVDTGER